MWRLHLAVIAALCSPLASAACAGAAREAPAGWAWLDLARLEGEGIRLVERPDAGTHVEARAGRSCRSTRPQVGTGTQQMLFDLVDERLASCAELVVVFDLYDEGPHYGDRTLLEYFSAAEGKVKSTSVTSRAAQAGAAEAYRCPRWRRPVVVIPQPALDGRLDGADLRLAAKGDSALLVCRIEVGPPPEGLGEELAEFRETVYRYLLRSAGIVIARSRFEDRLRALQRTLVYGRGWGLPLEDLSARRASYEEKAGEILGGLKVLEELLSGHYYDSPALIVHGETEQVNELRARIERQMESLEAEILSAERGVEELLEVLYAAVGREPRLAWFERKPEIEAGELAPGPPGFCPLRERIRFYAFNNAPWDQEFGERAEVLWELTGLFGVEGRWTWHPFKLDEDGGVPAAQQFRSEYMAIDAAHGYSSNCVDIYHHSGNLGGGMPGWFEDAHGGEGIHAVAEDGSSGTQVNLFHPAVRDYASRLARSVAAAFRGERLLQHIGIMSEGVFPMVNRGSTGYSGLAVAAFRRWLRAKHGDIATLNTRWGTDYAGFDEIGAAPCSRLHPDRKPSGLVYDWERWRRDALAEFIALIYRAAKEGDPERLIWSEPWGLFNNDTRRGLDFLKVFRHADVVNTHMGADALEAAYNHMFHRYLGKILAQGEFVWSGGGGSARARVPDEQIRAVGENSFWSHLAWGYRGFNLWARYFTGRGYSFYCDLYDQNYVFASRFAGAVAVARRKADRFGDLLWNSEVSGLEVGIIQPSTTMMVDPISTNHPRWASKVEAGGIFNVLYSNNYPAHIVPEEFIADGRESLADFRLLVAPYAPYMEEGAAQKLLEWVRAGGTLLASGPAGVFNQYARPYNLLLREAVGECRFELVGEDVSEKGLAPVRTAALGAPDSALPIPQDWFWKEGEAASPAPTLQGWLYSMALTDPKPGVEVVARLPDGQPVIVEAPCGSGRLVLSTFGLAQNGYKGYILGVARRALPVPFAASEAPDALALLPRRGGDGRRYLCVMSHDFRQRVETEIRLRGRFERIVDLGAGDGMPVPLRFQNGLTVIPMRLAPGEGTVLDLGPAAGGD